MQEIVEALEHEVDNAMKNVEAARTNLVAARDANCSDSVLQMAVEYIKHSEGYLERLRTALEILMLVGRD